MKILVDNALSHRLAELLCLAGHDAVHLRDRIPIDSPDEEVFDLAKSEGRLILSSDTDFGAILADRSDRHPSFVLLRHDAPAMPEKQVRLLEQVLEIAASDLKEGAIVSVHSNKIRVRKLPIR